MKSTFTLPHFRMLSKRILGFTFFFLAAFFATAQYSNGPLSTGATSSGSVAAPAGFTWSELQGTNASYGFGANIGANLTLADDFIVPAGQTWNITKMTFYAYSTGYVGATSPFNDIRIRIFNTNPSVGAPVPVFGDLTTNRFTASSTASMYRIAPGLEGTTRQIWKIEANLVTALTSGTYWIEWQVGTIAAGASNFTPTKTVIGTTTQAGNNAMQHDIGLATWTPMNDAGSLTPQDFPFVIDYTATGTACTAVAPGNTLSTAASVCPSTPFTLSVQTPGSGIGLAYQWQSGAAVGGPFTDIAGATNATYTTTQTVATYYRLRVTCGANPAQFSNPLQVTMSTACYCTPTGAVDCTASDVITNVTIATLNNSSACSPGGYGNYTTNPAVNVPDLTLGTSVPMSVTVGPGGTENVAVWIDYDHNSVFDASEFFLFGSGNGSTINNNLPIQATGLTGITRMRVRVRFSTVPTATQACNLPGTFGEVEDYNVNLIPCVPATVTTQPAAQTATCGATATFTAAIGGSAPSYQWEVQTTPGGIWTNLTNAAPYSGVTTNTLTINPVATSMNGYNYRLIYTNGCIGATATNAVSLTVNPIPATVTQVPATLCAGGTTAQTITVTGGGTGVFSPNAGLFTDAAHTIAYTGTAVTTVYAFPAATTTYSLVRTNGACVSNPTNVTVTVNAPIAGTPVLPAATAICANAAGSINFTGITGGAALTYQWQVNTLATPGTFTNVTNGGVYSGATTATLTITNPTAAMTGLQYKVIISSASCGTNVTSNATTLTVNPVPVVVISASPGTVAAPTSPVTLTAAVSSATAPITYQWYLNTAPVPGATGATFTPDVNAVGDYSVRVTDANGCGTATSTPLSITITRGASDIAFIYPSPNSGVFQVRFYNATANSFATQGATVNVFDEKGSRVYTQRYVINGPYTQMNVDLGTHARGIYRVEITNGNGDRLKTGSVMIF